ncbi:MAG: hypothetical protein JSS02_05245 [Planctomycetes bacterium]|nr:hypothetical protein [Planctomycetota bacterium]
MLGVILGVFTFLLGAKGFSAEGLPLTKNRNITGGTAKVIGVVCMLLGGLFVLEGLFGVLRILAIVTRAGR